MRATIMALSASWYRCNVQLNLSIVHIHTLKPRRAQRHSLSMRTLFDNSLHPLSLSLDLDQIAPVDAPQETISSRQPEVKPVAAAPHQAVQAPQPVQMVRAPSLQLKLLLLARFVRALSHDVMANTETAGCARLPRLLRRW